MKKIVSGILVLTMFFTITGCSDKKESGNDNQKVESTQVKEEVKNKELVIYDDGTKYTTTFTYNENKKYEIKKTIKDGKFIEVIFEIPEKNLSFDVYYFESTKQSYETSKENRKDSNNFKEYTWNKYNAYIYNADNYSLDFDIIFNESEDTNMVVGLFGNVSYINYKTANVIEDFNSEEVQKLLNTITFKIG